MTTLNVFNMEFPVASVPVMGYADTGVFYVWYQTDGERIRFRGFPPNNLKDKKENNIVLVDFIYI